MTEPPPTTTDAPVDPVLRGRLTWLRPAERDDIGLFVRWLNDARTIRYLGARAPISHALEERWFDKMLEGHGRDRWFFVICRLGDDVAIGNCGLFGVDLRNGGAGLGISIGEPDDRNQGLGTDALEALVDFGFGQLRLERLWLDVYTWNARAMRSYEKAGFVLEGTMRHAFYRDGAHQDAHRMAILRTEWVTRRAAEPIRPPVDDVQRLATALGAQDGRFGIVVAKGNYLAATRPDPTRERQFRLNDPEYRSLRAGARA